jgi:hypothetical protein
MIETRGRSVASDMMTVSQSLTWVDIRGNEREVTVQCRAQVLSGYSSDGDKFEVFRLPVAPR